MSVLNIRKKVSAWRAAWFCLLSAGVLLDCLAAALWLAAAVAGAILLLDVTREQRILFTTLSASWLLWKLGSGFSVFLPGLRLRRFAALVESALPELRGRLLTSLDLAADAPPPGASPAFVRRHLEDCARLIGTAPRPAFISFKKLLTAGRLAGLSSGLFAAGMIAWSDPKAFYWFLRPLALRPLEDAMEINPGDAEVLRGRPFRIEASFKRGGEGEPALFLRGAGASWTRGFMAAAGTGRFVYAGAALESELSYRLTHGELQSRVYRLRVAEPPALKDLLFSIIPPAYTGEKRRDYPYLPFESAALKGSLAVVSGAAAGKLFSAALIFQGAPPLPLRPESGGRLGVEFTVTGDASYRLVLKTADGVEDGTAEIHSIKALADQPPSVEVLSPAFGALEAAPEEEITAVYEASDDIGLREIRLRRSASSAGAPVPALSFDRGVKAFTEFSVRNFSGEAALDLYDLPDGTEAEFYFSACDRSPSGVCAKSGVIIIKAVDFSARHASAYAGLDALKKELGALKERENGIIADLGKGRAFTPEEMAAYAEAWRKAAASAERLGAEVKKDPYMASGTQARYELLGDDMAYGARTAREKAVPETLSGPAAAAAKTHETLRNSLEAGERDLEAALRFEGARLSAFGFESMARNASAMAGELSAFPGASENSSGGAPGDEDWRKLERTLEKISAELSRINAMLKDRPPRKSDGRTFALPAGSALTAAGELAAAIKAKDAGKAAALAAGLAEKLSQMRRVMEEYAAYQASTAGGGAAGDKTPELSGRWKTLYEEQSAETAAGGELAEKLFPKTERARTALLAELEAAQAGIAESLIPVKKDEPGVYAAVLRAGEKLKVRDMDSAGAALGDALAEIRKSSCAPCAAALRAAEAEVSGSLAAFARLKSDAALLGPDDLFSFEPAAARQDKVRQESGELARMIDREYSGALAGRLLERLEKAGSHMRKAVEALSAKEIRPAAEEQLKALEELELGGQSLDEMLEKMKSASSGTDPSARPQGVFARPAQGVDAAPVKLPKAGDYIPPAELRKKVMESLKERYPASQKDLIEEYLKNVAK